MEIRLARPDDLDEVVAIYNAAVPGRLATADTAPVTVDSKRQWFEAHDAARRPLWIAEVEEAMAGWCSLEAFNSRPAYDATLELSVYVSPGFERMGIGRGLVQEAIGACPGLGVRTLVGLVFAHNAPSLRLLERLGFVRWGFLPRVAELDGVERDLVIVGLRVG